MIWFLILVVSIPQAVWIACNSARSPSMAPLVLFQYRKRYGLHAILRRLITVEVNPCFNTASGMDCMQCRSSTRVYRGCCFNTASGMDCMQYCLPEALETVSPEVGFLILTPFSRFSPKCAELFCREKCFERGLKPVIARALSSTKEI